MSSLQNIRLKIDKISKCFEKLSFISFYTRFPTIYGENMGKATVIKTTYEITHELKTCFDMRIGEL